MGTRGSTLSLAQTNIVISKLQQINPNNKFDVKIIKTKGIFSEFGKSIIPKNYFKHFA